MSINRREFLRNSSIATAGLVAGSGLLHESGLYAYPAPATSDVSFVGGASTYNVSGGHKQMIKDVVAPFHDYIAAAITAGKRILIKPNNVYTSTTNDPEGNPLPSISYLALQALIEYIQSIDNTVQIYIAEASAQSPTTTVFSGAKFGYLNLSSYSGKVTLVDLNTNLIQTMNASTGAVTASATTGPFPPAIRHLWRFGTSPGSSSTPSVTMPVYVSSALLDPNNFVISICRLKTHNNMTVTGVTKNICMGFPLLTIPSNYTSLRTNASITSSKVAMHDGAASGQTTQEDRVLAWNIFQNASILAPLGVPHLSILDAYCGMEHNGPVSGTAVSPSQYCAVAGKDNLAVDRLGVKLAGLSDTAIIPQASPPTPSYTDCRYLVWQSNAGYGNYDLNKINFVQGTLANLTTYVKSYQLHDNYSSSTYGYCEGLWQGTDVSGPSAVHDTIMHRDVTDYSDPPAYLFPQSGAVNGNQVKIEFSLPAAYPSVRLSVLDLKGKEVANLYSGSPTSGRYAYSWNCTGVANGNYVVKLQFGSRALCDPLALAR